MLNRGMKQLFKESNQMIQIDEEKRREAIVKIIQAADDKKEKVYVDRKKVVMNQIRYMDKSMLRIKLLVEFIVVLIFLSLGSVEIPREDIIAYAIIFSGIMGVLVPGAMHRSFTSNIVELSETCYFNTKQMIVFQMVYSGISSLVLLTAEILFVGTKWQVNLIQIGLYILVPFVFSCCCCLGAMLTETGRRSSYTLVAVGLFSGVFYMVLASTPYVYQTSALMFWGIALVVGGGIMGIQLHILFHYIDKGEILCMN